MIDIRRFVAARSVLRAKPQAMDKPHNTEWAFPIPQLGLWKLSAAKLSLLLLRVGFGWFLFYAGWQKLYAVGGWSATDFLLYASKGPFVPFFHLMAGKWYIDTLVIFGELAVGLGLMVGAVTRVTAASGITLFLMLYMAHLPPVDGWVSAHAIYIMALVVLASTRCGTIYGIDSLLQGLEKQMPFIRHLL